MAEWNKAPKLSDEEMYDLLAYETCGFKQQREREQHEWQETMVPAYRAERSRMARLYLLEEST